ncbi:MAG: FAD:protein FMN transferase [Woeseiaceae bacterium]
MPRASTSFLLAFALVVAGCNNDSRLPQLELSGSALGTTFSVLLVNPGEGFSSEHMQAGILETLEHVDRLASTWREDSELSQFNANSDTGWIDTSAEFCNAIERAVEVSRLTDGAFDITIGPLVNLWGFGPTGDVREPPAEDTIRAMMSEVGYANLQTRCEVPAVKKLIGSIYVDLSGWAKGYAVDQVASLLERNELQDYLVEIGGEMRVRGHNAEGLKWAVAVETPSTTQRVPHQVLRLTDTGIATSGDYRNYFEHDGELYSHTLDARTGRPVAHSLAAVTVVNPSAAYADAMATALRVLGPTDGPQRAEQLGIAAYFLIRNDTNFETITTATFDRLTPS